MTTAVAEALAKVDQLSPAEQLEVHRAIGARIPESDDLTDDEHDALAAAAFRRLDEEEEEAERRA